MGEQDLRQWVLLDNKWKLLDQIKNLLHVKNIIYIIIYVIV